MPPRRLSLVISVNNHVVEYELVHGIHFDYYARRHFAATVGFYVQTTLLLIICILISGELGQSREGREEEATCQVGCSKSYTGESLQAPFNLT